MSLLQTADREIKSSDRWAYLARCGGLLAVGRVTGLLLVIAIDCPTTTSRVKT